jgi:CRISPR-associated endoribonuclease Cas6
MRFKITFNRTGKQRMLPMDYQYYLSAWIYKVIGQADPEFSDFLHSQGYLNGHKSFKLFGYSPLSFGKPVLWKEKSLFEIQETQLSVVISFHLAEAAERFIIGLFNNQQVYVGDRFNGLDLQVNSVERLPSFEAGETVDYRVLSPVVASTLPEGKKYPDYLNPEHELYEALLRQNLVNKFNSVPGNTPIETISPFRFELKSSPRSKLITIKPYTPEQSKVRGFVFDFTLTCPKKIHHLIEDSGLGEKNSMGFGWVQPILNSKAVKQNLYETNLQHD